MIQAKNVTKDVSTGKNKHGIIDLCKMHPDVSGSPCFKSTPVSFDFYYSG